MSEMGEGVFSIEVFVPRPGIDGRARRERPMVGGPLPESMAQAAAAVLADLLQPRSLRISLSYATCEKEPSLGTVLAKVGDEIYGFGVDGTATAAELTVALADGIQEHLSETALAWAEARPACPGHGHPASPRLVGGVASWVCPAEERVLCAIGGLAA